MQVYFIQAGKDGPVKIGIAKNAQHRRGDLQVAHHEPLHIIRVINNTGYSSEAWLHKRYKHLRITGEWFRYDKEMLFIAIPDFIEKETKRLNYKDVIKLFKEGATLPAIAKTQGVSRQYIHYILKEYRNKTDRLVAQNDNFDQITRSIIERIDDSDLLTAAQIENLAKRNGLSMRDVCMAAKWHISSWYRWKNGQINPTMKKYKQLVAAASGESE